MDPRFVALLTVILASSGTISCDETVDRACDYGGFTLVSSVNHLSFSVARELYKDKDNFLYSPLGLLSALGMAYLGASGQTAKEIEDALMYTDLGIAGIQVHEGMHNMTSDMSARVEGKYTLNLANVLFLQSGLDVNGSYTSNLGTYYNAPSTYLKFDSQPLTSMDAINEWVRNLTSLKIRKLLQDPLPPDTAMFLVNAIYFKGEWKVQFQVERTIMDYFFVASTKKEVVASMMILTNERFRYLTDVQLGYKFLEMPYKGEQISMLLALPLKHNQIPDLNMTSDILCTIRSNMVVTKLDLVAMPRFKIEFSESMKSILRNIGIVEAFSAGSADFSAMKPGGGIYVSDVRHKAVIEVNEQGSEAAAVSSVHIMPISAIIRPDFLATHSFLFYIIDTRTGLVLFSGRLMEP